VFGHSWLSSESFRTVLAERISAERGPGIASCDRACPATLLLQIDLHPLVIRSVEEIWHWEIEENERERSQGNYTPTYPSLFCWSLRTSCKTSSSAFRSLELDFSPSARGFFGLAQSINFDVGPSSVAFCLQSACAHRRSVNGVGCMLYTCMIKANNQMWVSIWAGFSTQQANAAEWTTVSSFLVLSSSLPWGKLL